MLVLMLGLFIGNVNSQVVYTPEPDSRLWIEGRSNVNQFECRADTYRGDATIYYESDEANANEQTDANLEIEVAGFDCGRERMNRDFRNALKANSFPKIIFRFGEVLNMQPLAGEENTIRFNVMGYLTVAGVTREITFDMIGYFLSDDRIRAVGSKQIKMTDYEVEPPTAMLGLVKAENELTVHFDLLARRDQ